MKNRCRSNAQHRLVFQLVLTERWLTRDPEEWSPLCIPEIGSTSGGARGWYSFITMSLHALAMYLQEVGVASSPGVLPGLGPGVASLTASFSQVQDAI